MSFLAPKTEMPNSLADNTPGRQVRNSPTQQLPLVFGRGRLAVQWVTPVLHWQFKTNDKQTNQTAYFSCYGWVCLGPIDEAARVYVNGKIYCNIFKHRDAYPGQAYTETVLSKPVPERFTVWWGEETHANYGSYLNAMVRDASHPMYGKAHPGYRGVCAIAVQDMEAGSSGDGQTPPLPSVELEVYRRSPKVYSLGHFPQGTHPVGIAHDILTLKRGGLKLPASYINTASWDATIAAINTVGVAGMKAGELYTSFVLAETKEAGEQLADVLSYFDGFLQERAGQLCIGYSPNDGSTLAIGGLRQINQHHLAGEMDDQPGDLDSMSSSVVVTGLDWLSDPPLSEASETAQVPFARRILGETRPPKTFNRPGFLTRSQLKGTATLMAAIAGNPDWEATVPILRQYALQPDNVTPLRPGDLFVLNVDQVGGINVVVRVLSRESDTPVSVIYRVRRERGTYPRAYEAALDPRVITTAQPPSDLVRYTVKELPPALSTVPAVTAMVERPSNSVAAYEVHYAPTNTWPGQIIATLSKWSIAAVLRTTLTAVTTDVTISVDTVGTDWSYLASQSALQQRDDTLVCCHGGEWFSVGTITPTGGGAYSITLKRARLDSEAEAHAIGDLLFFTYRAQLAEVRHAGFSDLYVASVYDVTTATKWFKLRPSSNGGLGNLTAAFSLQIQEPDVTLDDPNLFYTFIFIRNPTLPATPTGDTPAGWSDGPPAGTDPLWMSRGVKRLDTGALVVTWNTPVRLDGERGGDGTNGVNTSPVFIYKRSASAPTLPSVSTTFTFATGALAGLNNGWTQTVPGGTDPLYVSTATAVGTGATDTITAGEWAAAQILAQNGLDGTNGNNTASVFIYQRAVSAPTLPSATTTYTFATGGLTGLNNGWQVGVPSGTDPLYVSVATAFGTGTSDTIASGEWSSPVVLASNGSGTSGLSSSPVFIYQRAASAPTLPSATTTYTFATGGLTGLNNGWSQTIPGGTDPLYVSTATAASTGTTDTIGSGEWAAAQILAQNGAPGGAGTNGGNSAPVLIYQRAASAPTLPSATATYTFSTGGLTGLNNGWQQGVPAGSNPLYVSVATAFAAGTTDTIASGEWAAAVVLAQNGTPGGDGTNGLNTAPVFIYQRAASAPTLPSATTTFTFATGGLTGLNNGWSQTIPGGTDPLYVSTATAASTGATDTITAGEWATAQILAQNGAPGGAGTNGGNSSPVFIYQRAASTPTLPSATTTYTFATGGLTGLNNGWQVGVPSGSNPLWVSVATAYGTASTDTIAAAEWATPVILAENGADGNSITVEYSVDGSTSWHSTFTAGDLYMRQRIGGGSWSAAIKIVGENGTDGTNGGTIIGEVAGGGSTSGTSYSNLSPNVTVNITCDGLRHRIELLGGYVANASGSPGTLGLAIFMDGALVAELGGGNLPVVPAGENIPAPVGEAVTPGAGLRTFNIRAKNSNGGGVAGGGRIVLS